MRHRIDHRYDFINAECPRCGFDLRGSKTRVCAECGQWFRWSEWRTIRDARRELRIGCWLAFGTMVGCPLVVPLTSLVGGLGWPGIGVVGDVLFASVMIWGVATPIVAASLIAPRVYLLRGYQRYGVIPAEKHYGRRRWPLLLGLLVWLLQYAGLWLVGTVTFVCGPRLIRWIF